MKSTRRVFSLLIATCLLFATVSSVSAETFSASDSAPSTFEDFCNDYYLHYDMYTVYDKDGYDISSPFYSATILWYESNNIEAIFDYSKNNVSRFKKIEYINDAATRGAIQSVKQTETFHGFVNNREINDYDIVYTLTGKFSYNINTGEITSYSSPTIALTHVGISNLVSGEMASASTSAKKTSDGYGVVFSGQFNVTTTMYIPNGFASVPFKSETTGPYKATFTAYGA